MSIHSGDSSLVHSPGEKDHALDKKMSHTGPTTTTTADVDPEKVGLTHTKSATAADSDEELRRRAEVRLLPYFINVNVKHTLTLFLSVPGR